MDDVLKGLRVKDEVFPDCVEIEGIVYSKALFRAWGEGGMAIGQLYRIEIRHPDGALVVSTIREALEEKR